MYYPYFLTYMLVGLAISVPTFLWALYSGQFRDQKRACFLPLEKDDPDGLSRRSFRIEMAGIAVLVLGGLLSSGGLIIWSLLHVS